MFITYIRLVFAFLQAFWILFIHFPKSNNDEKRLATQQWSAKILSILGISVEVIGELDTTSPQLYRMLDRKSTRLNSSHSQQSRMPSSA